MSTGCAVEKKKKARDEIMWDVRKRSFEDEGSFELEL